jgi:hypothetical protein
VLEPLITKLFRNENLLDAGLEVKTNENLLDAGLEAKTYYLLTNRHPKVPKVYSFLGLLCAHHRIHFSDQLSYRKTKPVNHQVNNYGTPLRSPNPIPVCE